jgi:feruloyl esterase
MNRLLFSVVMTGVIIFASSLQTRAASKCEDLLTTAPSLPSPGRITAAETISSGIFGVPIFCRVAVSLTGPESVSNIKIEIWMPNDAKQTNLGWKGIYLGIGTGGYGSAIDYAGLKEGLSRGYAVANTDTGTSDPEDPSGGALGSALLKTPQKWRDNAYRATYFMTATAKSIIGTFYGRPPDKSYFNGCSMGGQQALLHAQNHPDDYDGIIAGAPAMTRHAILGFLWAFRAPWLRARPEFS